MLADDATEQEAPSTTEEPQDEEDVEGQSFRGGLTQDPDFDRRAASSDDDTAPPEGYRGV